MTSSPPSSTPPLLVLDTNVVLDLWLFNEPGVTPLREALRQGHALALVTDALLAELADVLQRPFARARGVPPAAVAAALQGCSRRVTTPPGQAPWPPRCSDGDDQKFVDLAWHAPADWLVSRDRAVLKLARAARTRGLRIGTPEQWAGAQPAA